MLKKTTGAFDVSFHPFRRSWAYELTRQENLSLWTDRQAGGVHKYPTRTLFARGVGIKHIKLWTHLLLTIEARQCYTGTSNLLLEVTVTNCTWLVFNSALTSNLTHTLHTGVLDVYNNNFPRPLPASLCFCVFLNPWKANNRVSSINLS